MQSKKYLQSPPNSSNPRPKSVASSSAPVVLVATCAEKSFDVNKIPDCGSNVATVSGHRGVGAVVNRRVLAPPNGSSSPVLTVRRRARRPFGPFHAFSSASEDAGVPGLSAA